MTNERAISPVVDVQIPVRGRHLPADHRLALARALVEALPQLAGAPDTAIHPVSTLSGGAGSAPTGTRLLSTRSRVLVRTRRELAEALAGLAGTELEVDGCRIALGVPQVRELLPHGTLYAHYVCQGPDGEAAFLGAMHEALDAISVRAHLVCGRSTTARLPHGPQTGCSLMLHGLSRAGAQRVLEHGLGPHRLYGCGLFVPHKSAAAVGADD